MSLRTYYRKLMKSLLEEKEKDKKLRFHKDNFRHLPRFPDFFVTFRILSSLGIELWAQKSTPLKDYESRFLTVTRLPELLEL